MRLIVCGSRHWTDRDGLFQYLDELNKRTPIDVLIEGEAPGADVMSREWAKSRGVVWMPFPADWKRFKKAAGPVRNRRMMDEGRPDAVLAFHDNLAASTGTLDMLRVARKAGVPYTVVRHVAPVATAD